MRAARTSPSRGRSPAIRSRWTSVARSARERSRAAASRARPGPLAADTSGGPRVSVGVVLPANLSRARDGDGFAAHHEFGPAIARAAGSGVVGDDWRRRFRSDRSNRWGWNSLLYEIRANRRRALLVEALIVVGGA